MKATIIVCDGAHGNDCKNYVTRITEGIVLNGSINDPADGKVLAGGSKPENNHAYCWSCFHKLIPYDSTFKELNRTLAETLSERRRVEEAYYREVDNNPSKGPSGPLMPPELPHVVRVAANICGVRSDRST